jgi:hypothetical protein
MTCFLILVCSFDPHAAVESVTCLKSIGMLLFKKSRQDALACPLTCTGSHIQLFAPVLQFPILLLVPSLHIRRLA